MHNTNIEPINTADYSAPTRVSLVCQRITYYVWRQAEELKRRDQAVQKSPLLFL